MMMFFSYTRTVRHAGLGIKMFLRSKGVKHAAKETFRHFQSFLHSWKVFKEKKKKKIK